MVRELDPNLPLYRIQTVEQIVADSLSRPRFFVVLLAVFAGVALALAAVGLYGVLAYAVRQRTREIGVRIALGARGADVLGLVVRQGLYLTVVGVVLGAAGAAVATRTLKSLLFGVEPLDPLSFIAACVVLLGVAALACFLPARRAARVDPLCALRD
jgi:putative ABC transport system permease protein